MDTVGSRKWILEIDLVLEGGGRVVAVEVKAAARVGARDARHLAWLRDQGTILKRFFLPMR
jgi:Holliday junction resolvase-like predicted endonuclease